VFSTEFTSMAYKYFFTYSFESAIVSYIHRSWEAHYLSTLQIVSRLYVGEYSNG